MKKSEIKYEGMSSLKNKEVFFAKSKMIDSIINLRGEKVDIKAFTKERAIIENFICEFVDDSKLLVEGKIKCIGEYCGADNTTYIYTDTVNILFSEELNIGQKISNRNKVQVESYIEDIYLEQLGKRDYLISLMLTIAVNKL
ncbi:MAG: hypothetical protein ACRC57_13900 [Sarcina sp.]